MHGGRNLLYRKPCGAAAYPHRPGCPVLLPEHDARGLPIPGPRFRRVAFVAVIDRRQTVALVPGRSTIGTHRWTLPSIHLHQTESYASAARRLLAKGLPGEFLRWGRVEGRRWAPVPTLRDEVRREAHVLLFRWTGSYEVMHAEGLGPLHWAGRALWSGLVDDCGLPDIDLLLIGYVEGWIPDGPITLE